MTKEGLIAQFIAACHCFVGVKEERPNGGQMVDLFLKATGLGTGYPWCAAFLAYVGKLTFSVDQPKTKWPVPLTAACLQIGNWAKKEGVLKEDCEIGDLFLLYYPSLKRFAHTGVVIAKVPDKPHRYVVIDGNTSTTGSREGWVVAKQERTINPSAGHRFVRWVDAMQLT